VLGYPLYWVAIREGSFSLLLDFLTSSIRANNPPTIRYVDIPNESYIFSDLRYKPGIRSMASLVEGDIKHVTIPLKITLHRDVEGSFEGGLFFIYVLL